MSGYPENAFTIASTDNLDFVHSHARVYCGKQQSSWHGTTIQIVKLQPSKLVNTSQEKLVVTDREAATHAEATTSSNTHLSRTRHPDTPAAAMETLETRYQACLSKRSYSIRSPVNSPGKRSPLPKRKRRMRTGTEGASRNLHEQFHSSTSTQMTTNTVTEAYTNYQGLPAYRQRRQGTIGTGKNVYTVCTAKSG